MITTHALYTKDCIRTRSGVFVNVIDPDPQTIIIEDIAHALSNLCRFGGHLPLHYSIAQHSVYVAQLLSPELRLQGLLHDATEAYLVDVPTPLKNRLTNYREIEDNFMKVIAAKFGIEYPFHAAIKRADNHMLHMEWDNIMLEYTFALPCWSATLAKNNFLKEFHKLTS